MRLTTKCRHAVTALIHLANHAVEMKTVSLAEISSAQGVSVSYLEQIFAKLRHAKLVIGTRGPGGGYRLNKAPEHISIADIIDAVESIGRKERLESLTKTHPDKHRIAQNKWNELSQDLYHFLSTMTLSRFVAEEHN